MSVARSLPTFTVEAVRLSACWTGGTQAEVTPSGSERVDMTCVWGVLARVEAWVSAGFGCCWRRAKPVQAFPSEKGKGASEESFPGAWRSLAHYEVCLLAFVNAWVEKAKCANMLPDIAGTHLCLFAEWRQAG